MSDTVPRAQPLASDDVISVRGGKEPIVETVVEPAEGPAHAIVGRSPWQLAWARLRRDRVGMLCGWIVLAFIAVAICAPLIEKVYGVDPETGFDELLDGNGIPLGYFGGVTFSSDNPSGHWHILGVQPQTGRDIFMQLIYGARTSLSIAFAASTLAVLIGVVIGVVAGYFGGWVDAVLSWFIDFMLAFPFLLFAIAVIPVVNTLIADDYGDVSPGKRIATIIIVFGAFAWMTTARLVRGQVLSLREREYVEAARACGAGPAHIMFKQILPNLWAPILVAYSLAVPATVTAEAALSFLNIGVVEPTPDWGRMIGHSITFMRSDPWYTLIPGLAIFVLVLTFNLFGDALRDALDPKSVR